MTSYGSSGCMSEPEAPQTSGVRGIEGVCGTWRRGGARQRVGPEARLRLRTRSNGSVSARARGRQARPTACAPSGGR